MDWQGEHYTIHVLKCVFFFSSSSFGCESNDGAEKASMKRYESSWPNNLSNWRFFSSLFDALRMALPQIAHLFTPIIEYETQDKTFRSDHIGHCARETSGTNGRNQSMNILSIEASLCPVQIQIHRLLKKKSFLFAKYNNIMRHGCCE